MGGGHPYVPRENGIQGTAHFCSCPTLGHANAACLAARMNSGVGAAGAEYRNGSGTQPPQRFFEAALHGSRIRLSLPTSEPGSIVVQHELQRSRRHARNIVPAVGASSDAAGVEPIDFAASTREVPAPESPLARNPAYNAAAHTLLASSRPPDSPFAGARVRCPGGVSAGDRPECGGGAYLL